MLPEDRLPHHHMPGHRHEETVSLVVRHHRDFRPPVAWINEDPCVDGLNVGEADHMLEAAGDHLPPPDIRVGREGEKPIVRKIGGQGWQALVVHLNRRDDLFFEMLTGFGI